MVSTVLLTIAVGPVRFFYNPYFQLLFLVETAFFSHNKLAGTMFWLVFSAKRTGPHINQPELLCDTLL